MLQKLKRNNIALCFVYYIWGYGL